MVRLKAPMFSLEASGTIGKSVVFAKWKGRDYARRHAIPANPQSGLQTGIRTMFRFITQDYANLSAADVAEWEAEAEAENLTPLNAQVADAMDRARRNLGVRENLTDADPGSIDAPTNGVATAQPKTLVVTWDDPAANKPDYVWMIYASVSTGFTPDISNVVGAVKYGSNAFTHRGLTTGVAMYYRIRGLSTSGFMGTLIAEFTGTPA